MRQLFQQDRIKGTGVLALNVFIIGSSLLVKGRFRVLLYGIHGVELLSTISIAPIFKMSMNNVNSII